MIFKPELARLVAKGKKTQTRRIVNGKPSYYEVGQDYAVCPGRGKHQICRIIVLDREQQRLGDLTYEAALAEGFRSRADFARYWIALHRDKRHPEPQGTAEEILEFWQQRYGDRGVWVITFELVRPLKVVLPDKPVYLMAARSGGGTTTDPRRKMAGEPAVMGDVSTGSLARAITAARRARQAQLQEIHRLVERARTAYDTAVAGGMDLGEDVAALEQVVVELEAKLRAA